jgi:TolB protein
MFVRFLTLFLTLACLALPVQAEVEVTVSGGKEALKPIAVPVFAGANAIDIAEVIETDLSHSGYFKAATRERHPAPAQSVPYANWQQTLVEGQPVENLVVGDTVPVADGFEVRWQLLDVARQQPVTQGVIKAADVNSLRLAGHRVANAVFQALTGLRGQFDTKIAFITATGYGDKRRYELVVADSDGENPIAIATHRESLMSPTWSPDRRNIAFVGFEKGRSAIFVVEVATGKLSKVVSEKGINGAPSWSPDGGKLAVTLSYETNPDIYILDLASGSKRRITDHYAIDTEPTWSPDGSKLAFTSDRGGTPQIYVVSASGGEPRRVSFQGRQNLRARFAPDGQSLVMVSREGRGFRVALQNLQTGSHKILTEGPSDEAPCFSPNGAQLLFVSQVNYRGFLNLLSLDGKVSKTLPANGDVREPAWSPLSAY